LTRDFGHGNLDRRIIRRQILNVSRRKILDDERHHFVLPLSSLERRYLLDQIASVCPARFGASAIFASPSRRRRRDLLENLPDGVRLGPALRNRRPIDRRGQAPAFQRLQILIGSRSAQPDDQGVSVTADAAQFL
jgi:hypothetical protein